MKKNKQPIQIAPTRLPILSITHHVRGDRRGFVAHLIVKKRKKKIWCGYRESLRSQLDAFEEATLLLDSDVTLEEWLLLQNLLREKKIRSTETMLDLIRTYAESRCETKQ